MFDRFDPDSLPIEPMFILETTPAWLRMATMVRAILFDGIASPVSRCYAVPAAKKLTFWALLAVTHPTDKQPHAGQTI